MFKLYENKSKVRKNTHAHCKQCGELLVQGVSIMIDRHIYYCSKCGNKLRAERIARLEAKITKWKKL